MNLMNEHLKGSSGHIESLVYDEAGRTLVVTFFDRPESWTPVVRMVFRDIDQYDRCVLDEDEDGFIDVAIGFDQSDGSYCLHTSLVEINFRTQVPPDVEKLVKPADSPDVLKCAHHKAASLESTFDDLFSGGASVWLKMAGGAVVTIGFVLFVIRGEDDPTIIAVMLVGGFVVGAVTGAALSFKDVVQTRMAANKPRAIALCFGGCLA